MRRQLGQFFAKWILPAIPIPIIIVFCSLNSREKESIFMTVKETTAADDFDFLMK